MTSPDMFTDDRIAQAIGDPGSIVGRKLGPSWGVGNDGYAEQEETVTRWSTRAVHAVLAEARGSYADKIAEVRRRFRADGEIAHECDVDGWEPVIAGRLRKLEQADSDGWRRSRLIELIAAAEEYLAALDGPVRTEA